MKATLTRTWSTWTQQKLTGGVSPVACPLGRVHVSLGSDCSGADAPVFALQALGVRHRHVFSCDIAPGPRKFISMNCAPEGPLFHDLLNRKPADVPAHNCYVAGFPCKAFSMLNTRSRLLKERTARPFFGVLKSLQAAKPHVAVLENVGGIKRVLQQVLRRLSLLGCYHTILLDMNPVHLGREFLPLGT